MILMKHIRLFLNNGCVKLDLEAVKHRQYYFSIDFRKTHKDNPKFYSGYISEVEALFSILRDYNLVI